MKVLITCLDFLQNNGLIGFQPVVVTVNDERFFKMTCPNGHQTLTVIQQPKHEVLFELGMNALVDGYPREAVTSFASCLENFYEFCIKQVSLYKGVDPASLESGWKCMAKQSERQLGAFVMLWINYFGSVPALLSDSSRGFRNRVVHQGYIPQLDDTLSFGDDVVECVVSNLQDMQRHLGDDLDSVFTSEFLARASPNNQRMTTQSIPTTIGWAELIQNEKVNLRTRMDAIVKNRVIFQWPNL